MENGRAFSMEKASMPSLKEYFPCTSTHVVLIRALTFTFVLFEHSGTYIPSHELPPN
jgi:hypothetical protein